MSPGAEADTHPERRDDIAAYALGALEPAEATELEAHLEGCGPCRAYLAELGPAVDLLPASVPPLAPPPALRERLVGSVRAEAERIRAAEGAEASAPGRRWRTWRGIAARPATAMAAGAVLVAGAAAGWLLHDSGGADHSVVDAHATAAAPPGSVSASLDRVDGAATLQVRRMPAIPRDDVYEVWALEGSDVRPKSTFVLRQDGSASAAVPHLGEATAVLVTREPRGGSDQPTSAPLLRATLAG
jgi:anti-sigma-K factor RskA